MKDTIFGAHAVLGVLLHQPKRAIQLLCLEKSAHVEIMAVANRLGLPIRTWNKAQFQEQLGHEAVHQGLALQVREFPYVELEDALRGRPKLCVVLDSIEDPRNLGRAARSAFAMGAELLVIPKDRAVQVTSSAEKASVGTLSRIPVARVTNLNRALDKMRDAGLWIIGTSDQAKLKPWKCDLTKPIALVVGNEEKGIRKQVLEHCDEIIQIPMASKDMSLNAADAATVMLYEALRQRQGASA
ncbi:MAG: 23S rRNA (guanosine(2251)-2'-O)-methyltransferase RlmB [Myxococcaceae bacterium]|nr:23S rRNA (guanosine(2251)-2'-O)-methyltransferase RlmB [Myxococcaceae bacterium]MBH2006951.1 23S rRNA (guanosine(2251)-2'-O)-methyltransferase RlmB [Myxococcaceae bacterium]